MISYSKDVFPYVTELFMNNPIVNARRKAVLADVQGDVLEIGFGSGLNGRYYGPDVRRLTALDPSSPAWRLARRRLSDLKFPVDFVEGFAESMTFPDEAFDTVVLTWTLCSVHNPTKVLENVRRVLKSRGRLYFLEHGLSDEPRVQRFQKYWTPLQRVVCAGCRLTLRVDEEIAAAGFTLISLRKGYIARPKTLCFVYEGMAEKSARVDSNEKH